MSNFPIPHRINDAVRRCFIWGIALNVLGPIVAVYGPKVFASLAEDRITNQVINPGLDIVDLLITTMRWTLTPLGCSLIAAGIVIRVLGSIVVSPPLKDTDFDVLPE
ncbi:hypothetical protein FB389_1053 [Rarobacter incanus]|uniref:Uncharacterized protein n=1 Tax=Rarobacter incanus TaxID=153494 RepID=A0A542SP67_9MICO|nr:hypothetical protein FB389_1053 [Rarobacter incanus]